MIVLKRANPFTFASHMVSKLVTDINTKIRRYCSRRVIELGLVPASFDHEFKFGSNYTSVDNRKSVSKMKSILLKYIIKLVPFTAFASDEFVQVHERDSLIVNIYNSSPTTTLDSAVLETMRDTYNQVSHYMLAGSRSACNMYMSYDTRGRWCYRYCRYINYVFRKNGIPVVAVPVVSMIFNPTEYQKVRGLGSSLRETTPISFSTLTKIRLSFAWWQYCGSYEEPGNTTTVIPDEVYGAESDWMHTMSGGGYESIDTPMKARFNIAKLFCHLDEGLKIFTTLSRKASYGSAAFSFKSN